jgi:hypothetical protein
MNQGKCTHNFFLYFWNSTVPLDVPAVGKPDGKRLLGRPRCRRENSNKMDVNEIGPGGCGLKSSALGSSPMLGFCEHENESSGYVKCREFLG